MNKAILYTRVSSKEQVDEGSSLESQKRRGYDFAASRGLEIVKHFEERGESAKTTDRTQLKEMIQYVTAHKGEIDALLIYKVDRLSRNTGDYLALKHLFNLAGITIVSMTENFDDSAMGRAMETVSSAFAQLDNENRAERSKGGMIEGIREGRWQWKAPIGFINARVNGKKNIAPDPREGYAEALRSAWTIVDAGESITDARKIVNQRLVKLGYDPIPHQTFSFMLRKPIYKGVLEAFGLTIQSKSIKPFVEPNLFDRVQLVLNGHKNSGRKYKKINPDFPLKGVLTDVNGHYLRGSHPRGNGGVYSKYHCPNPDCKGKHVSYDVDAVEEQFLAFTKNMKMKNDIREALTTAISLNIDEIRLQSKSSRDELDKKLIVIKAEKKELSLKHLKGVYSDNTTQELMLDYEKEEAEIRLELSRMSDDWDDAESLVSFGLEKLSNLSETFLSIEDVNVRSRFQNWLFPAGLRYDGKIFGTSRLPLIYRLKQNTLSSVLLSDADVVIPRRIELRLPG